MQSGESKMISEEKSMCNNCRTVFDSSKMSTKIIDGEYWNACPVCGSIRVRPACEDEC